jgi:hypothetical protein
LCTLMAVRKLQVNKGILGHCLPRVSALPILPYALAGRSAPPHQWPFG